AGVGRSAGVARALAPHRGSAGAVLLNFSRKRTGWRRGKVRWDSDSKMARAGARAVCLNAPRPHDLTLDLASPRPPRFTERRRRGAPRAERLPGVRLRAGDAARARADVAGDDADGHPLQAEP